MTTNNPLNTANSSKTKQQAKSNVSNKLPMILCGVSIVFLILILAFALYKNSSLKQERNQAIDAYNATQVVPNVCQDSNSICLYGKTTAVDDYLLILSRTLQTKPSTSYDIMLEVVPTKLAHAESAINTDCRPNNHHLYICQRMTTSNPKKLLESLLGSYDNLNPNIEYNVALILSPRATLIADDSQPENLQMAPTNATTGEPEQVQVIHEIVEQSQETEQPDAVQNQAPQVELEEPENQPAIQ